MSMGFGADDGLGAAMADSYNRLTAERAVKIAEDNAKLLAALIAVYGLQWDGSVLFRSHPSVLLEE